MSAAIKWNPSLYLHIKEIDDQHERLVQLLNSFFEEMTVYGYKGEINRILDELKSYGNYHFETEEKYFERFDYPKKEEHKAKHEEFRVKIIEFENRFAEHEPLFAFNLSNFLEEWLLEHISKDDREYMDHFHKHGL